MPEMRYRKPSVKTLLGVTKWKKRAKKALGINKILWPFRALGNYQRRMLRRAGYYSPEMKMMRAMRRGQVAGPIGPLQVGEEHEGGERESRGSSLLMAAALAQQGKKKGRGHAQEEENPNLTQAILLAAAMKGTKDEEKEPPRAAHHHAAAHADEEEAPSSKPHRRAAQAKPRRQSWRLFGLLLMTLLVAAGIGAIWFFWLA